MLVLEAQRTEMGVLALNSGGMLSSLNPLKRKDGGANPSCQRLKYDNGTKGWFNPGFDVSMDPYVQV